MLRNSACTAILEAIFLLTGIKIVACNRFHYVPRNFPRGISFIESFKRNIEGHFLSGTPRDEVTRMSHAIESTNLRERWNGLYDRVKETSFFKEKMLSNFLRVVMSYADPEILDSSENNRNYFPIPKIRLNIEFFNLICNKLTSIENFYRVVFANLFINLNRMIGVLNEKADKGLIPNEYSICPYRPSRGYWKLGRRMHLSKGIPRHDFYDYLIPRVVALFKYISSYPEEKNKVIYKNIFDNFEVLYFIQKLARFRMDRDPSSDRVLFTISVGKLLTLLRLSILEYLGCEHFGNTDPELTYAKKGIQEFIEVKREDETVEASNKVLNEEEGLEYLAANNPSSSCQEASNKHLELSKNTRLVRNTQNIVLESLEAPINTFFQQLFEENIGCLYNATLPILYQPDASTNIEGSILKESVGNIKGTNNLALEESKLFGSISLQDFACLNGYCLIFNSVPNLAQGHKKIV